MERQISKPVRGSQAKQGAASARQVNTAAFEQVWTGGRRLKQRLQYNLEAARKDFLHVRRSLNLPTRHVTVLDVGFGNGMLLFSFARSCCLLGTELSRAAIRRAQQAAQRRAYEHYLFVIPDDSTLPFRGASCDVVIASHVVEHVADDVGFVGEMLRVLKPGGHLVVVLPLDARQDGILSEAALANPAHLTEGHYHVRNYNLETLLLRLERLPGRVVWAKASAQLWDWKCRLDPARQRLASRSRVGQWADRILAAAINIPLALVPYPVLHSLDVWLGRRGYRARQGVVVLERLPAPEAGG